ncbi:MAG: beta-ketoacyl-ACP synthase [Rhizobiaceae bacterium]|jgi:3-oxoacyl-[acyl-carrier-protein] synthase II|nr:beta-ketoacyl-ACP synthase [Rhizobiaceae bacterium]
MAQDVAVTGIGLVSSCGAGLDAHRTAFFADAPAPALDTQRHAPLVVHAVPDIDWSAQVPRREQRQMELWQKLGVYGAGLALENAGLKDNLDLCRTMDMIIAAGGGERDLSVDETIIRRVQSGEDLGQVINAVLTTDLRPTLFLAQLSNLLAGNISICHKVTGSSRTFMGEESAGVSALKIAVARIRAGQSTHALVGGSYNGEDADFLLSYQLKSMLATRWSPVWEREAANGLITGSAAAFLVLEARQHAEARGAPILALLGDVAEGRARRDADAPAALAATHARACGGLSPDLVISGASGFGPQTALTSAALAAGSDVPARAFSSLTGYLREPQFLFATALAALAVSDGRMPTAIGGEHPASAAPAAVLAETAGLFRGEGAVLVRRA